MRAFLCACVLHARIPVCVCGFSCVRVYVVCVHVCIAVCMRACVNARAVYVCVNVNVPGVCVYACVQHAQVVCESARSRANQASRKLVEFRRALYLI